ncbi:hypothetical protein SBD_1149 [Streptomyces bottropensis ATCC 25435]|uniref:Uncharacterized protein n=1 Tax=Streptomyces bottropensis ATCC 25435 TaxID=1054862 RepID=M3DNB0_9ACTN|nr:hypothetical protein SBD_1149 [Streptomyces bottropensis ATCC 25435]
MLTAVAASAVPFDVSTAPAAADPEYPSSDRLEKPVIVPPAFHCHGRLLREAEPDRTNGRSPWARMGSSAQGGARRPV